MVEISVNSQSLQWQVGHGPYSDDIEAAQWAEKLFEESYAEPLWSRVWSWMRPKKSTLMFLHPASTVQRKKRACLRRVPLSQIKGSCSGRVHDFDAKFRPCRLHDKERWLSVAKAIYMRKSLPPVELVKVDDIYFVLDGHHRLSVAESLGSESIEANVTEWVLARPC